MKNIEIRTIKIIVIILFFTIIPFLINCGYHLSGAGSSLPEGAKTIAIPDFDNLSTSPDAQQYITFAIRDEFIKRSKLKLLEDVLEADLVLEGNIKQFSVEAASFTERESSNLYRVILILEIKLVDTINDKIIFKSGGLRFTDTYDIDSADFFTEESATLDKIAKEIASSITTRILEAF